MHHNHYGQYKKWKSLFGRLGRSFLCQKYYTVWCQWTFAGGETLTEPNLVVVAVVIRYYYGREGWYKIMLKPHTSMNTHKYIIHEKFCVKFPFGTFFSVCANNHVNSISCIPLETGKISHSLPIKKGVFKITLTIDSLNNIQKVRIFSFSF